MGLGLQGAGAVGALQAMLRARALAAQQAQQQGFDNSLKVSADARANRALDEQTAERQAAEADRVAQQHAGEQDKANTLATARADQIPPDTFLGGSDPVVPLMQKGGVGSLLSDAPARPAMGQDFQGPMPGDAGGAETPQQAIIGRIQGYIKGASQKQIDTNTDNSRQATRDQQLRDHELAMEKIAQQNADKPPRESNPQPQVFYGADGKPHAIQFSGGASREIALPDGVDTSGGKTNPNTPAAAEKARSLTNARTTLDRLDSDINTAASKGLIGPSAGRISDIEMMVGNNDPAISTLATRMVAAKMLVDAGIGGMRGAASPGLMARWDKLMNAQATPENMHAVAQVMREMVGGDAAPSQNASAPAGAAPQAPAGWKYVQKPGGGWTAVEAK